jgi:hypothetical protein
MRARVPTPWHYTIGEYLPRIIETGLLLLSDRYIGPGERPAVWFSLRQDWEPTAAKFGLVPARRSPQAAMTAMAMRGGGLVRIGVLEATAPFDWREFRRHSGLDPKIARGLAITAKEQGADPYDWRVSFDAVPSEEWIAIELWDGRAWVGHPNCARVCGGGP